jgi:MarR family transcriptional regulator for hemolysin
MPDPSESLTFVIFDLVRLLRLGIEAEIGDAGLGVTPAEARILSAVRYIGPVRQHALADRLGISRMSATELIDRLETRGLVRREADPEDRRAKRVSLTPDATPMLEKIDAAVALVRDEARGDIAEEDWEVFRSVAQRMRRRLLDRKAARCRKKASTSHILMRHLAPS